MRRLVPIRAFTLVLAAFVAAAGCTSWSGQSGQPGQLGQQQSSTPGGLPSGVATAPEGNEAFYKTPEQAPDGAKAGDLIWGRTVNSPAGSEGFAIAYWSTAMSGKLVPVTAVLFRPSGPAPSQPRAVLAWAHGTFGLGDMCAPSQGYLQGVGASVPVVQAALAEGLVFVATDYQGLGTPGVHQYVVGATEARNVLDSVKAAKQIDAAGAGDDVVVLGWSQGGGAAIFAGQASSASYGKPLRVRGVAALAPAADIGPEFAEQTPPGPSSPSSPSHDAVLALNVFRGFAAAYPGLDTDGVVAPPGRQALKALDTECTIHLADVLQELGIDPPTMFTRPIPADWQRRLDENTAGNETTVAPLLILQGTADTVVNPNGSTQYVERACKFSQPVNYSVYRGATHQTIPFVSQNRYVRWIADRFARKRATSTC
jgi:alpha-beta hydrolase superfamily lysophospholipase